MTPPDATPDTSSGSGNSPGWTAQPAFEVRNVSVHYGEVTALSGVNLVLGARGVTGLVGMNGSGKSTLFKTIMGLIRPTTGRVLIGGDSPQVARKHGTVAYVPQSEAVDWAFPISVREVVMMGRYGHMGLTRRPGPDDHAAVDAALEQVHLSDLADRQIGQLSGGQKKRAFVARGIAQGAEIMLLDEPFAGVDQRSEATMVALLRQVAAEGRTVLVSSHDLHALPELADDAVLLMRRVLFHGPVAEALTPEKLALAFGLQDSGSRTATHGDEREGIN
ncbi:metal ABC transporter ATP-binding protein [Auritidibacter sp. NML130574]|uniref:metal ABC transporter ATP-binding protein n=1 Tax=Auritidibacter sp. NML130574 TaxID=2170745 RepID=UPI000D737E12|nr:metal ABC transporter ATP-binding protein [Auritidibacter sp. NML130574]AXR74545.1 metal ABC transporter ATP-binding protein [Auritidibacter sp. NML130574]